MLLVHKITFSYLQETTIHESTFSLEKGNNLAIIGESGCGKSTLLKLIYGMYDLDDGAISWMGRPVLGPKYNLIPGMDFMKYLAQDFDLMPYITVAENVGKYVSNVHLEQKNERIGTLLELVEMSEFASVKAKYLSGGQMQRVAIARVLALEPEVLLLDEPFSHIDNFRKNSLRRKLFSYLKQKKITTIVATHDSTDVLSFANQVLVMKNGTIVAHDSPKNIYKNPKTYYTASLFGDVNEINIDGKWHFIYPHQLQLAIKANIQATVLHCYFRGNHYLIQAQHNTTILYFENENALNLQSQIYLSINLK